MKAFDRESHCRCEQTERADLSCSRSVAETGGLPTPVGLVGTVPAVLAAVGSRWSHAALLFSSSYDICGCAQIAKI